VLRTRSPFAAASLLGFLRERAVPGVEEVEGSTYRRSISTAHGPAVIALTPVEDGVRLDASTADDRAFSTAEAVARGLFDLDADPRAVGRVLSGDPFLRPLVRARPGIRVPGAADGFELAVRAIVGQQVSVRGARTVLGRIAAAYGEPTGLGAGAAVGTLFPSAGRLRRARLEHLGVTSRRARAIRRVAALVAPGALVLTPDADRDEVAARLLEIEGVGPWTVEYVRMRALRDPDAFLAGDLGIRRAFERLGLEATPAAIAARAEAWRPVRASAAMLLWSLDAPPGAKEPPAAPRAPSDPARARAVPTSRTSRRP
jgi:AraC family transcriptional regulator of adaptative response / DNA-3-methyladenine glycosylase II